MIYGYILLFFLITIFILIDVINSSIKCPVDTKINCSGCNIENCSIRGDNNV